MLGPLLSYECRPLPGLRVCVGCRPHIRLKGFLKIRHANIISIPTIIIASMVLFDSTDWRSRLAQSYFLLQNCDIHSSSIEQVSPSFLFPWQTILSVQNPSLQHGVLLWTLQSLFDRQDCLQSRKCEQTPLTQHLDMHSKLKSHISS